MKWCITKLENNLKPNYFINTLEIPSIRNHSKKRFSSEQNKIIIEADENVGYVCIYTKDLQWLPENSGTVRRVWESSFNFKKFNNHETQELCSVKQTHFTKK